MAVGTAIEYEGLQDLLRALKLSDADTYKAVAEGLAEVGVLVRDDAQERFRDYGGTDVAATHAITAEGLKVRVRTSGAFGLVQVEQSKRKTTSEHPEYGGAVMRHGLLPARTAELARAERTLEARVVGVLRQHGVID